MYQQTYVDLSGILNVSNTAGVPVKLDVKM